MATMNKTDLYYQVALEALHSQEKYHNHMKSRAMQLISAGAFQISAGAIILGFADIHPSFASPPVIAFMALIAIFLVGAGCSIWAALFNDWHHQPWAAELYDHMYEGYDDRGLTEWVSDAYSKSVACNRKLMHQMTMRLQCGLVCLALQACVLAIVGLLCFV